MSRDLSELVRKIEACPHSKILEAHAELVNGDAYDQMMVSMFYDRLYKRLQSSGYAYDSENDKWYDTVSGEDLED